MTVSQNSVRVFLAKKRGQSICYKHPSLHRSSCSGFIFVTVINYPLKCNLEENQYHVIVCYLGELKSQSRNSRAERINTQILTCLPACLPFHLPLASLLHSYSLGSSWMKSAIHNGVGFPMSINHQGIPPQIHLKGSLIYIIPHPLPRRVLGVLSRP